MNTTLVGRTVTAVRIDEDDLIFETTEGPVGFRVEGDCCSTSFFYDLIGLDKLRGNKVVAVNSIEDENRLTEPTTEEYEQAECLAVYGYEFVSEHPEFGEVTTVVSFRNDSNGYYGGWMEQLEDGTAEYILSNDNAPPVIEGDNWQLESA
jgi:hypothetical protein